MKQTRRAFLLSTLPAAASACFAQGVVPHKIAALPRGKRSGLPYGAHFVEVAGKAGIGYPVLYGSPIPKNYILESIGCGCAFLDYDNDGWIDILVLGGNSFSKPDAGITNLLFLNNRDGTFREEGGVRGVAYSDDGQEQAGMGLAVGDTGGSGHLDIFKTNFAGDLPVLYRNLGKGIFEDATRESGLAVDNRYVCWGAGLEDFDNDGWPDIPVATGHIYPELESRYPDSPYKSPLLLYRNLGHGRFGELYDEAGTAILEPHSIVGVRQICTWASMKTLQWFFFLNGFITIGSKHYILFN
jgi:hypothetical protein